MYTERIDRALQMAAIHHEHQYRKNPEKNIPYVYHVAAVGMMLAHYGYSEETILGGLLHDIVEDTDVTLAEIESEFGDRVRALVEANSELDKDLPWEERKARLVKKLESADEEAQAISCCGIIHNMQSMIRSLRGKQDIWKQLKRGKEQQLKHFTKMLTIFRKSSLNQELVQNYARTLEVLKDLGTR